MAVSVLSLMPANYLENFLVTNPNATTLMIGGITYTRAQILAQFNAVADPSENASPVVGLTAIAAASKTRVLTRADVA